MVPQPEQSFCMFWKAILFAHLYKHMEAASRGYCCEHHDEIGSFTLLLGPPAVGRWRGGTWQFSGQEHSERLVAHVCVATSTRCKGISVYRI